ncbi:hypothetical protein L198_01724 [Cryptococcus wingfieldii CBS 7118]|uniref:Uncharacterized protein n=1 Tax=Cryptococcus wingfieldii CBS 7118 TaxID=1295528 RepID=A0A1E3K2Q9_9TREE|nr:hypothetical protein L198_01724 [Cryptococcus wingfieldii CBS 7118]ODO06492.1 hypothetical protein L198_01724 [Cryptococcus wingfieldii CBS 7118]
MPFSSSSTDSFSNHLPPSPPPVHPAPAALALSLRRHLSDQSFASPKGKPKLRLRISQWSVKNRKSKGEIKRRNQEERKAEDRDEEEYNFMRANGLLAPEEYEWERKLEHRTSVARLGGKGVKMKMISLPSISTSPSAFSFPAPPPRDSISKSINLDDYETKTQSLLAGQFSDDSTQTMSLSGAGEPEVESEIESEPEEQATPTAVLKVAVGVPAIVRSIPSMNSFMGQPSFVLPEEVDIFYRGGSWSDELGEGGELEAIPPPPETKQVPRAPSQHLSVPNSRSVPARDGQFTDADSYYWKAEDGQFSDIGNEEAHKPAEKPLPVAPRDGHFMTTLKSSRPSIGNLKPSHVSDLFSPDVTGVTFNAGEDEDWSESTPGYHRRDRMISSKFYEHCETTFETEECDTTAGALMVRQDSHKLYRKEYIGSDGSTTTLKQHRRTTSVGSTSTDATARQPEWPLGTALTQNLLQKAATKDAHVRTHSDSAPPRPSTDSIAVRILSGTVKKKKPPRRSVDHEASPAGNSFDDVDPPREDVEVIESGLSTHPSIRRPSISSSVVTTERISFSAPRAVRPSHSIRSKRANSTTQAPEPRASSTYTRQSVTRSHTDSSVPRCLLDLSHIYAPSSKQPHHPVSQNKPHRKIHDPFAVFDPYPPIVPVKQIPNDPWIMITSSMDDDMLRKKGWKKVEMRRLEGEGFWAWMNRKVHGEGLNEARERMLAVKGEGVDGAVHE